MNIPRRQYSSATLGLLIQRLGNYEPDIVHEIGQRVELVRRTWALPDLPPKFQKFHDALHRVEKIPIRREGTLLRLDRYRRYWAFSEGIRIRRAVSDAEITNYGHTVVAADEALPALTRHLDALAKKPGGGIAPFPPGRLPSWFEISMNLRMLDSKFKQRPREVCRPRTPPLWLCDSTFPFWSWRCTSPQSAHP